MKKKRYRGISEGDMYLSKLINSINVIGSVIGIGTESYRVDHDVIPKR